jgi:hypothetical protein
LRILGALLLLPALAWAAGSPEEDAAEAYARQWVDTVAEGKADLRFLENSVAPGALEGMPAGAGRQYYRELALRLGEGAPLRQTLDARPDVVAVQPGPDYTRVVLGTEPPLTFRVRELNGELLIDAIERSPCVVCTEEERFIEGLIMSAGRSGGRPLLVANIDLLVDPEVESRDPDAFQAALQQRNVRCGFARSLLHDAEVLGSDTHGVTVALGDRTESWPVVYVEGRWMVDYSGLPEDSPLRLPPADLGRWQKRKVVSEERQANWYPVMEDRREGTVIADEVLWFSLRPVQNDLLLYTHDLARVGASAFVLDPESGEVSHRLTLPTLDKTLMVEPENWREAFSGSMHPDGSVVAIASLNRLWLAPMDGSRVRTDYSFSRIDTVAYSPDGAWLAVGEHKGVTLLDADTLAERGRYWGEGKGLIESLAFDGDQLWVVHDDGAVVELALPDLSKGGRTNEACCGGARGGELDPATGELVIGCDGECAPAWMWSWDGQHEPVVRADESYRADRGVVSVDPLGRYLVSPTAEGRVALWDRREEEPLVVFGEAPLVQVAWDPRGELLYGLDDQGRLWRWRIARVLGLR